MSRIVNDRSAQSDERRQEVNALQLQQQKAMAAAVRIATGPVSTLAKGALISGGVLAPRDLPAAPNAGVASNSLLSPQNSSTSTLVDQPGAERQERSPQAPAVRPGLETPVLVKIGSPDAMRILTSGVLPASVPAALEGARAVGVELTVSAEISGRPRKARSELAIGVAADLVLAA
jgi:hypothetical protein